MESIKYFPGIMSDIKLVSEEYTSKFVTGPQLQTELSKKQDYVGLSLSLNDQNVQVDSRGFTQIGLNKSNYFDGPVKFSSPIYDKNDNEIIGGGGGGETKAKKWYCYISDDAADCKFWNLTPASESEIESIKVMVDDGNNALITFKEEKSMNEVNEWLIFRAKLIMGMEAIYDAGLGGWMVTAICPWPEDKPWPLN